MTMNVSELPPLATPVVETRYRRIHTAISVPESIDRVKRLRAVEPRSMAGMPPISWHQAEGFLMLQDRTKRAEGTYGEGIPR